MGGNTRLPVCGLNRKVELVAFHSSNAMSNGTECVLSLVIVIKKLCERSTV